MIGNYENSFVIILYYHFFKFNVVFRNQRDLARKGILKSENQLLNL